MMDIVGKPNRDHYKSVGSVGELLVSAMRETQHSLIFCSYDGAKKRKPDSKALLTSMSVNSVVLLHHGSKKTKLTE